ncbi:YdcF family protein [bacterium]|nr:YdcF family protein [bacterium]
MRWASEFSSSRFIPKKALYRVSFIVCLLLVDLGGSWLYVHVAFSKHRNPCGRSTFDAGVVFFDDFDDHGGLGPGTIARLDMMERLYRKNFVRNVICVGGVRHARNLFGAAMMKERLTTKGIASERVYSDSVSFDSVSNWMEARKIIRAESFEHVLLVSSALHLFRLQKIAQEQEIEVCANPYFLVPQPSKDGIVQHWKEVHHEWLAWLVWVVVPRETHSKLLRFWRNL